LQGEPNSKGQATTPATARDKDPGIDMTPIQLTYPSNQVFVQPDDLVPHPRVEPTANPLRVKSFEALDGRARPSSDEAMDFSPRSLTILLKAGPNKLLNVVLAPAIMTKESVIARNPDGPQCNTTEQKPEATNRLELPRESACKDGLFPIRSRPGCLALCKLSQELSRVGPCLLRGRAAPEPMKSRFIRPRRTHGTTAINSLRNFPSLVIYCYDLMPDLLDKISFFPRSLYIPCVLPFKLEGAGQDQLPFVNDWLGRLELLTKELVAQLRRVVQEVVSVGPLEAGGIQGEIPYLPIEEKNGDVALAPSSIDNPDPVNATIKSALGFGLEGEERLRPGLDSEDVSHAQRPDGGEAGAHGAKGSFLAPEDQSWRGVVRGLVQPQLVTVVRTGAGKQQTPRLSTHGAATGQPGCRFLVV
jgi:hypothetical protein